MSSSMFMNSNLTGYTPYNYSNGATAYANAGGASAYAVTGNPNVQNTYNGNNQQNPMNAMQAFALIFAGLDLLDNGVMDGSILRTLSGQQQNSYQQPQPQPQQQNPNIGMMQQMMQQMMQMLAKMSGMGQQSQQQCMQPQAQAQAQCVFPQMQAQPQSYCQNPVNNNAVPQNGSYSFAAAFSQASPVLSAAPVNAIQAAPVNAVQASASASVNSPLTTASAVATAQETNIEDDANAAVAAFNSNPTAENARRALGFINKLGACPQDLDVDAAHRAMGNTVNRNRKPPEDVIQAQAYASASTSSSTAASQASIIKPEEISCASSYSYSSCC